MVYCTHSVAPPTCECDLIWKRSLCRYLKVYIKAFKVRKSSSVTRVGGKSKDKAEVREDT